MIRRLAIAAAVVLGSLAALLSCLDAANVGTYRALLTNHPPSWVLGFPNNAASLDDDFARGNYWQAGTYCRDPSCALNASRASTEYQADLSSLLHVFASGVPAITNVGLGVWQASTNESLYARDMTQTPWVKVNITTALTATGADGVANSATLLTATAGNATVLQTFTIVSEAQEFSLYVERKTGTGEIDITENNGVTWTALTSANCVQPGTLAASAIVTTNYVRCAVEATVLNPVIGLREVTSGDAIAVDFAQLENNTFATPPIVTLGTTQTREADVTKIASSPVFNNGISIIAAVTPLSPSSNGSNQAIVAVSDGTTNNRMQPFRLMATGVSNFTYTAAGNSVTNGGNPSMAQSVLSHVGVAGASGDQILVLNGASIATGSQSGYPAGLSIVYLGSRYDGSTAFLNGFLSRVSIWPTIRLATETLQQMSK
jgi:hypothetical protein